MPTILRIGGYRIYFYSHEPGEPPHVHVDGGGLSLKAWLELVELAKNVGFRGHEINAILALVREHRERCLEARHEYFNQGRG